MKHVDDWEESLKSRYPAPDREKPQEAFRAALTGQVHATDLGLMDAQYFLNNAGFGRRAVATLDPVGAEQPAERLRLGLSGDHRHANGLVFHAASVTSYAVRRSGRASPSSR